LVCVGCVGCGPAATNAPSSPVAREAARAEPREPAAIAAPASEPRPAAPGPRAPEGPVAVAFTPFGRVANMEERKPLWSLPASPSRAAPPARHYEQWHEKARATVGYGYLSILDLTVDERFL